MKYNLKKWNKQEEKIEQLKKENQELKKILNVQEATLEVALPLLYRAFDDTIYLRQKIAELEKKIVLYRIAR